MAGRCRTREATMPEKGAGVSLKDFSRGSVAEGQEREGDGTGPEREEARQAPRRGEPVYVLANGLTAYNQIYTIYFEGPSVTGTGGARHLECTVSSPNGTSLAYNEISYY